MRRASRMEWSVAFVNLGEKELLECSDAADMFEEGLAARFNPMRDIPAKVGLGAQARGQRDVLVGRRDDQLLQARVPKHSLR